MEIELAERKQALIKMGLQGPSGSGKTYSAILLAKGLVRQLDKVAVVATISSSSRFCFLDKLFTGVSIEYSL
jgi:pantothenate kinase-related protein Tda10